MECGVHLQALPSSDGQKGFEFLLKIISVCSGNSIVSAPDYAHTGTERLLFEGFSCRNFCMCACTRMCACICLPEHAQMCVQVCACIYVYV